MLTALSNLALLLRRLQRFVHDYTWWVAKNVIGWTLIVVSPVVGVVLPGPTGLPLFLIGFAMVTFPGKRRVTSRLLRGKPINLGGNAAGVFSGLGAVLLPVLAAVVLRLRFQELLEHALFSSPWLALFIGGCVVASYFLMRAVLLGANVVIRALPAVRRVVRPWMRRRGIDLLPPRHRLRRLTSAHTRPRVADTEILAFHPDYTSRAEKVWSYMRPWLRRLLLVALLGLIFYYMLRPVAGRWDEVGAQVRQYEIWRFGVAAVLFAAFLFFVRCITWLKMLKGFGHRIPLAAGTRVWVTGELARYLPGTVWQVLGRVHLIRPYGVSASVCSTSQILDIATFLLANLVLGMACLLWFWNKAADEGMRPYLLGGVLLLPMLTVLLVPKVFYGITNAVMRRLNKSPFSKHTRLRGKKLFKYFFTYLAGLLLQSLALWVLLGDALNIKIDHWWKLAGPYCLAWSAGFLLGWWAPGGIGVRELVFVGMVKLTMDAENRVGLPEGQALVGYLVFCSVLMRLWTITGELLVASLAYAADWKGALGRPDAPGRVHPPAVPHGGDPAQTRPPTPPAGAESKPLEPARV